MDPSLRDVAFAHVHLGDPFSTVSKTHTHERSEEWTTLTHDTQVPTVSDSPCCQSHAPRGALHGIVLAGQGQGSSWASWEARTGTRGICLDHTSADGRRGQYTPARILRTDHRRRSEHSVSWISSYINKRSASLRWN